ncbi:MAG TPA: hypothetical protein VGQ77_17605, partial [Methylomirabilota bacterium]|nr:hypothetical protein [Methylomirabilota bacterium]
MRRRLLWSALLIAVVVVAAWLDGLTPAEAQKRHKVVMFTKNVTNPFWKAVRTGGDKAARALGVDIEHAAP